MAKKDKKARHKAKRDAKKQAKRRADSISTAARLAQPGTLEVWISSTLQDLGQCQIFAFKKVFGLTGVACFLVDRGVVGLKDAWLAGSIDRSTFVLQFLGSAQEAGYPMRPCGVEEARQVIAGALRWADEHGMRLPRDWAKCAAVIGGIGDWKMADTSQFVKEFAGHPQDLRQRLTREPLESFTQRPDISFLFSDAAPYMQQTSGDYVNVDGGADESNEEDLMDAILIKVRETPLQKMRESLSGLGGIAEKLGERMRQTLIASGQEPAPMLPEIWRWFAFGISAMLAAGVKPVPE